ncbi:phage portal protein [Micromonospora sp. CA-248260]|uniref:phage portal protein n=1 Tax=Micromonospora sp. CA-248260 TaxID=3239962 RepID=UPI003D8D1112
MASFTQRIRNVFSPQERHANITTTAADLIPSRNASSRKGRVLVNNDNAMRHSAVWACLRLRADLISTMPADVFRRVNGQQIEVPKPPVLVNPGGDNCDLQEWLYSTQVDLDRAGNAFGLITERNGRGLPNRIELLPLQSVTVVYRDNKLSYRVGNEEFDPADIWHEKQYTIAGLPYGLSPIQYAAYSIGEYLSIQDYATDWFNGNAIPAAVLKHTSKSLPEDVKEAAKASFKANVDAGEVFVHGNDWEYTPIQTVDSQTQWLAAKQYGLTDIARFFGCPSDLIDAAVGGSSITYASMSQRNLQFLIMNLGPAIIRRENKLSKLTPSPQYVKLNSDALLRLDPKTRAEMNEIKLRSRQIAPSEVREQDNLPAFTDSQLAEFDRLYGLPKQSGQDSKAGTNND